MNAWADTHGLVLGEVRVGDKTNEVVAIPELLRILDLEGCIVTIDAAGCQKKIAGQIVRECKADYVLALKDNLKTFHDEMLALFDGQMLSDASVFAKVPLRLFTTGQSGTGTSGDPQALGRRIHALDTRRRVRGGLLPCAHKALGGKQGDDPPPGSLAAKQMEKAKRMRDKMRDAACRAGSGYSKPDHRRVNGKSMRVIRSLMAVRLSGASGAARAPPRNSRQGIGAGADR